MDDNARQAEQANRHDQLWGCVAIGEAIGLTKRQAFYLCRKGLLPAIKVGGRWTASGRRLRHHLAGDEATS
jgi:hypothetical protein